MDLTRHAILDRFWLAFFWDAGKRSKATKFGLESGIGLLGPRKCPELCLADSSSSDDGRQGMPWQIVVRADAHDGFGVRQEPSGLGEAPTS